MTKRQRAPDAQRADTVAARVLATPTDRIVRAGCFSLLRPDHRAEMAGQDGGMNIPQYSPEVVGLALKKALEIAQADDRQWSAAMAACQTARSLGYPAAIIAPVETKLRDMAAAQGVAL